MKKIYIIILIMILIIFSTGETYSYFTSRTIMNASDQSLAKFLFDTEMTNELNLDLDHLVPGDIKEYNFFVTNAKDSNISDVSINYKIILKTYHFLPLNIKLYKEDIQIGECNESSSRNEQNELVCNMPEQTMNLGNDVNDKYKLKIEFPIEYNDSVYSELTDYINIEIKSWQKI